MKKSIHFHMGMPKTGTSALQNALAILENDTTIYPSIYKKNKVAHHSLANILTRGTQADISSAQSCLQQIQTENTHKDIVFSSEGFMPLINKQNHKVLHSILASTKRFHVPELHLVLREMSSFLEAMYLQSSRFGKIKVQFPEYVASRKPWIRDFFHSLSHLQKGVGSSLRVPVQKPDFDTLSYFEDTLKLQENSLHEIAKRQRPSSRFGLNGEILLSNLEKFNEEFNLKITRPQVVESLESSALFNDDHGCYTLYSKGLWSHIHSFSVREAANAGLTAYTSAFESLGFKNVEHATVSYLSFSQERKQEALHHFS